MLSLFRFVCSFVLVVTTAFFGNAQGGTSPGKVATTEDQTYDYRSLAISSILKCAEEASKLPDVEQRVVLLIAAAKELPTSNRDDAIRYLEIALRDLKEWVSDDKIGPRQRYISANLRSDALSAYAKLDAAKAASLQKEATATATAPNADASKSLRRNRNWSAAVLEQRRAADEAGKIALSIVDTDTERAMALVMQSIEQGIVSSSIGPIFDKLRKTDGLLLSKLVALVSGRLASTLTLDPFSLRYASNLLTTEGAGMSPTTRNGFIRFLLNSLELWASLVKGEDGEGGLDPSYVSSSFIAFFLNVRPVIAQYAPEDLFRVDLLFRQVSPFVPIRALAMLQATEAESIADPKDRLADILKDPNPEKRDLRLIRLVSELLRNESGESQNNLDLASDAISGFSDPDSKSAFSDLLAITRVNAFVKTNKFVEAQRLAGSISSEETRAWALLALSTVAAKADRVLGFELISNALTALDKASPSPHKVELALIATAMLTKNDPQRAFDTLSAASRYANSSATKVDPPTKPPVAFGLDATIGEAHTRLGVFPESLGDVKIDPSLSTLGTTDWFRAEQIANDIREPALRLQLKLKFAEAVLTTNPKPQRKDGTKPSVDKETRGVHR